MRGHGKQGFGKLAVSTLRQARRLVLLVIGSTVVLLGILMLVTPGPGILLIGGGLALLAVEFAWARRLLRRVRHKLGDMRRTAAGAPRERPEEAMDPDDDEPAPAEKASGRRS